MSLDTESCHGKGKCGCRSERERERDREREREGQGERERERWSSGEDVCGRCIGEDYVVAVALVERVQV